MLRLRALRYLPGAGLNGKTAIAKVWGNGRRTVRFVAVEMSIKFPVHHCCLGRTWERNGQVRGIHELAEERGNCPGLP